MKKIIVFSLAFRPLVGGAEIALEELIKRLPEYHFSIITARLIKSSQVIETGRNYTIYRLGWGRSLDKYFYPIFGLFRALKLASNERFDLIWAMMATWAGIAALGLKTLKPQVPYLLTDQSGDSDEFIKKRTWWWWPVYRLVYLKADQIQVISQWLETRARSYGYTGPIEIIPNGVDIEKFSVSLPNPEKSLFRKQLGFCDQDKIVITASRLAEKNGLADLIKAVSLLPADYKLIIAGSGKLETDLKNLVKQLELEKRVVFMGDQGHQQLAKLYQAADVFCRPSLTEGFGNVFVEAMISGLPVVATGVGGIKDFLINGQTGLEVKVHDPENVARKIRQLVLDQDLREYIIENAKTMVKQKYSWDIIAKDFKILIEKIC